MGHLEHLPTYGSTEVYIYNVIHGKFIHVGTLNWLVKSPDINTLIGNALNLADEEGFNLDRSDEKYRVELDFNREKLASITINQILLTRNEVVKV